MEQIAAEQMKWVAQHNQIFQNLEGQFRNVSQFAGLHNTGFSQGIAVGDYNDDGFPDIFDANIGRNRLFRNNGDGTFSDVTDEVGLQGELWTTSAAIADIDGDGNADLFEVQYCSGTKAYTTDCPNSKYADRVGSCSPLIFGAEPDRVWRGDGSGRFTEVTDQWTNQTNPGRGLGLVIGRIDERDGLDLYVANDMTANHLWSSDRSQTEFQLKDLAVLRGLAVSGESLSQASMGIAAGDADGDGDLDFYVTHFLRDHNTYYEQVTPGVWSDRSFPVGFATPSMNMLGFGTEWIDFDNDGSVELIVTNGHVNDVKDDDPFGITSKMPAQVFWRDQTGIWHEYARNSLGEYFEELYWGRALATIDANRDGRLDVVITHLAAPVALLINQTKTKTYSLGLVLKATNGQRDAIGAIVTYEVGNRTRSAHLLAGDGYMCTNERRIPVGLGNHRSIHNVRVLWPSGNTESFGSIHADNDYLLVEGSAAPFRLP